MSQRCSVSLVNSRAASGDSGLVPTARTAIPGGPAAADGGNAGGRSWPGWRGRPARRLLGGGSRLVSSVHEPTPEPVGERETDEPAFRYHASHDVQVQVLLHVQKILRYGCKEPDIARSQPFQAPDSAVNDLSGTAKGPEVELARDGIPATRLDRAIWRKSRRSNPSGNCVEIATLDGEQVAVRNSRHPDGRPLSSRDRTGMHSSAAPRTGTSGRPAGSPGHWPGHAGQGAYDATKHEVARQRLTWETAVVWCSGEGT